MPPFQNQYMRNGYQPNISGLIGRAQQDIAIERPTKRPGMASVAFNHPGFLGYAIRSQDEYDDAVRHDKLVKRLREIRSQYPEQFAATQAGKTPGGDPIAWGDVPIDQDTTPSPYKWRGISAAGQPLREGSDWIRSVFSIPQNLTRVLGGSVNQADAEDDLARGIDTALMGIPSAVQGKDANPEWSNSQERPFNALDRLVDYPASQDLLEAKKTTSPRDGITSFAESFKDIGAPDTTATYVAGGLLDAVTDPFPLGPAAIRSALGKQYGKAALLGLLDVVPNVGMNLYAAQDRTKNMYDAVDAATSSPPKPQQPVIQKPWYEYH